MPERNQPAKLCSLQERRGPEGALLEVCPPPEAARVFGVQHAQKHPHAAKHVRALKARPLGYRTPKGIVSRDFDDGTALRCPQTVRHWRMLMQLET